MKRSVHHVRRRINQLYECLAFRASVLHTTTTLIIIIIISSTSLHIMILIQKVFNPYDHQLINYFNTFKTNNIRLIYTFIVEMMYNIFIRNPLMLQFHHV